MRGGRTARIHTADYFANAPEGMERLDGIAMPFIAIGESLKNIDKITGGTLLAKHSEIDWTGVKGFRDIIAHHYFDIDADRPSCASSNLGNQRPHSVIRAICHGLFTYLRSSLYAPLGCML